MSTNDPTAGPLGEQPGTPGADAQPSEEELRAAYEAELSRITSAELMLQAAVSLLNLGSYRLAPRAPGGDAGAPRRGAVGGRPRAGARRDRRGARAAGDHRAAACRARRRRCATRSRSCRWPTRARRRRRGDSGAGGGPQARGSAAELERRPQARLARRAARRARRDRGRPSPAAGCGCPVAERAPAPASTGASRPSARGRDRLPARLHRDAAHAGRAGPQMCARQVLARHANQTAEDFQLSSFLTNHGVVVALVCAACAVAYGLLTTRALLALSPGNEKMQSISLAVQQGARAYLNRQYTDDRRRRRRAVRRADLHPEHRGRLRLRDRRPAVGLDRLHRHERLGALERACRRGGARRRHARRCASPSAAARSPACSSSGSRCSASPATTAS